MKQYLAQGCDVNCVSDFFAPSQSAYLHDATALIIATNDHCNEALQLLLQNGCDVRRTNANGDNALMRFGLSHDVHRRACWSGNIEALGILINAGASIACVNHNGVTPRF